MAIYLKREEKKNLKNFKSKWPPAICFSSEMVWNFKDYKMQFWNTGAFITLQVELIGNPNMKFNSLPHMLPKLQEMQRTDGQMNNIYQKQHSYQLWSSWIVTNKNYVQ